MIDWIKNRLNQKLLNRYIELTKKIKLNKKEDYIKSRLNFIEFWCKGTAIHCSRKFKRSETLISIKEWYELLLFPFREINPK